MDEKKRGPSIWFRPWMWPRWTWAVAGPLMLAAYLFSGPVVFYVLFRIGGAKIPGLYPSAFVIYLPANRCAQSVPLLTTIWKAELSFLEATFGELPP